MFGVQELGMSNLKMTICFVNNEVNLTGLKSCGLTGLNNDPSY